MGLCYIVSVFTHHHQILRYTCIYIYIHTLIFYSYVVCHFTFYYYIMTMLLPWFLPTLPMYNHHIHHLFTILPHISPTFPASKGSSMPSPGRRCVQRHRCLHRSACMWRMVQPQRAVAHVPVIGKSWGKSCLFQISFFRSVGNFLIPTDEFMLFRKVF